MTATATITQKQRAARKVTQTIFFSLERAQEIDELTDEIGNVSRNKLINACIALGLQDKEKLRNALLGGEQVTSQSPNQPAGDEVVPNAYTTPSTPQGSKPEEIEA